MSECVRTAADKKVPLRYCRTTKRRESFSDFDDGARKMRKKKDDDYHEGVHVPFALPEFMEKKCKKEEAISLAGVFFFASLFSLL